MKKLILCVLTTIAIYAILYGLFAFVHMDFNPNERFIAFLQQPFQPLLILGLFYMMRRKVELKLIK